MCCHHQAGLQISPPKTDLEQVKITTLITDQLVKWGPFSLNSFIWPIWTPFSLPYIKLVPLSTDLQKKKKKGSLTNHFHGLISFTKLCVEQFHHHNIDKHYSSSTTMWCVNCEGIAHDAPVKEYLTNSFTHCNIYCTRDTLWCIVSRSGAFWVRGRYLFLYMTWVNSYPKHWLTAAKKYIFFPK